MCKHTLRPVYHLIGWRVETRRFQAMGQLDSTCTAPPGSGVRSHCCGVPGVVVPYASQLHCTAFATFSTPRRSMMCTLTPHSV
jgi:hypothetical protein